MSKFEADVCDRLADAATAIFSARQSAKLPSLEACEALGHAVGAVRAMLGARALRQGEAPMMEKMLRNYLAARLRALQGPRRVADFSNPVDAVQATFVTHVDAEELAHLRMLRTMLIEEPE